jgi:hypothetical protein
VKLEVGVSCDYEGWCGWEKYNVAKSLGMLENGDGGVARMEGAWQGWLWVWQRLKGVCQGEAVGLATV